MLTKMGFVIVIILFISHILSESGLTRILAVDGSLLVIFIAMQLLMKKKLFIYGSAYALLSLLTLGFFAMCYLDYADKVIINMLFIFIPPMIAMLYQNVKLIVYISILSCISFITNVLIKPEIVFYEGYPNIYNIYIALLFLCIAVIGTVQALTLNKLMVDNEEKQKKIEIEKEQTLELLKKEEQSIEAIAHFNNELSKKIESTNEIGLKTKKSFDILEETFNKTAENINDTTEYMNEFSKELQSVKRRSETMNKAISDSNSTIALGNDNTNKLAGIFEEIKSKSKENVHVTNELTVNSKEIESIIAIIEGITKRINLLSLNATIEASRAGEYGKGFEVIAQEIKDLSVKSGESTKTISQILKALKEKIEKTNEFSIHSENQIDIGNDYLDETVQSFHSILNLNQEIKTNGQNLDSKIDNLHSLTSLLVNNMHDINDITEENYSELVELNKSVTYISEMLKETETQSKQLTSNKN